MGTILAILSGVINNFGTVLQKKVVNDRKSDDKFLRSLIKNRLWLLGLILQYVVGSIFFMIAQLYIGPALIPGLMAAGLIVLAIGSIKIVGEHLKRSEILGIALMITAILFLGLSNLSIQITESNLVDRSFIIRMSVFTGILGIGSIICEILQRRGTSFQPIYLAILSGFMFSLSNFWIGPLMGVVSHILNGSYQLNELILFAISCGMLVVTNFVGTMKIQECFKRGQASNMIPIQQVPMQIAPVFVYFYVFYLTAPSSNSISFLFIGVIMIIISSFLLAQRQARLEQIK